MLNINDSNILLMLFYLTGFVVLLTIAIIALPALLRDRIEEAAKKLNSQRAGVSRAKGARA